MNTILISGTAKTIPFTTKFCTSFKVEYDVNIYAAKEGEQISFLISGKYLLCGYGELWDKAKSIAENYFEDSKFQDGAYCQFLDHLIVKS